MVTLAVSPGFSLRSPLGAEDGSLEGVVGKGVNSKGDSLANLHVTDVSLVDISNDAHIGEVLRDGKEFRRVKGGGHCLTFLHGLGKHHAIDGRGDGGVTEVGLSPAHTLFGRIHLLLGLLVAESGVLEIVGANQTFAVERLVASEIGFLIIEVALLAVEVGLSRIEFADKVGLIKFGYDLTFPHHTVVIHIEMGHNTVEKLTFSSFLLPISSQIIKPMTAKAATAIHTFLFFM